MARSIAVHRGRQFVGGILVAAALLKTQQLLVSNLHAVHPPLVFSVVHIGFEVSLGTLLIFGRFAEPVRLVAVATFGSFACVSLQKALLGLPSCGCFGNVRVNPLLTASFDLLVMLGLAFLPARECSFRMRRVGVVLACIGLVAFGAVAASAPWIRAAKTIADGDSELVASGRIVVLDPEKWVGKKLVLIDSIDVGERLASGRWVVVLYHFDCLVCREVIARFERRFARGERVALIEMPPYAPAGENPVSAASACLRGKLSDKHEWFATTPVVISLVDGRVEAVWQGEEAKTPAKGG